MKFRFLLAATATLSLFQAGPSVLANEIKARRRHVSKSVIAGTPTQIPDSLLQALSLADLVAVMKTQGNSSRGHGQVLAAKAAIIPIKQRQIAAAKAYKPKVCGTLTSAARKKI